MKIRVRYLLLLFAWLAVWPSLAKENPLVPVPEKAKEFVDPAEMLLRMAPPVALQKLIEITDDALPGNAVTEINRWFGLYAINKSIVLHTTVEAVEPHPDIRNACRIRAASVPLHLDGGTVKRLSWLYFQEADAPEAARVKVGAQITVVGWIRRCEIVITPEGPRLNFDLQYTKILGATPPPPAAIAFAPQTVETRAWRQGEPPVRLIPKDEGFCALTMVTGHFQGAGEWVKVWIADDGYWYLGGESHQEGVAAECMIVRFRGKE
ncbi:MAG TPA: hypothetical protein VGM54_14925 [Chthoniobacter sp.]|jgi:hypothetical protein